MINSLPKRINFYDENSLAMILLTCSTGDVVLCAPFFLDYIKGFPSPVGMAGYFPIVSDRVFYLNP